jgi:cellobiose-specific phosphotransferase system component IIA
LNNSETIIQRDRTELNEVDKYVDRLQKKVKKAHEIRDKLLETVKDLEESKQSRSWLLGKEKKKKKVTFDHLLKMPFSTSSGW